jgi:16S rRNA (cytidine1402-2'-O)-methyltransferase
MSKLIIVPTPVGNLEDITFRAVRVLKEADVLLAEDTRTTGVLLKRYSIETAARLQSHHKFNEHRTVERIVEQIQSGATVALVSDAGTPGISDPGFLLVRECLRNDVEVECLPGATAFVPALVASGLPCDRFSFEGFLPLKKGRQTRLKEIASARHTVVIYESPHRLLKTLAQLKELCGAQRQCAVARELTKLFEQIVRGSLEEALKYFTTNEPKGEFVIILSGLE